MSGIGFERLAARFDARKRRLFAVAIGVLLVAEFAAAPLATDAYLVERPAIDRWLDGQPKPFAIAEVPLENPRHLGAWERRHTEFMLHSTLHWQKTVEGYSGIRPPLHEKLYEQLTTFPDERSITALEDLRVTYIVVHTELYPNGRMAEGRAAAGAVSGPFDAGARGRRWPGLRDEHRTQLIGVKAAGGRDTSRRSVRRRGRAARGCR